MSKQTDRLCSKINRLTDRAERLLRRYQNKMTDLGSKEWKSTDNARRIFDAANRATNRNYRAAPTKREVEVLLKKWGTIDLGTVYAITKVLKLPDHDKLLTEVAALDENTGKMGLLHMLHDSVCADVENDRKRRTAEAKKAKRERDKQRRANASNAKAKVLAETVTEEQYEDNESDPGIEEDAVDPNDEDAIEE